MPIHHVTLAVRPQLIQHVCSFYVHILKPLGYSLSYEDGKSFGFSSSTGISDFGLHVASDGNDSLTESTQAPSCRTHVAFDAPSPEVVDKWYEAAIEAGGKSNGGPGERPTYGKGYYAAFIVDPLGNNIEAMCFEREG